MCGHFRLHPPVGGTMGTESETGGLWGLGAPIPIEPGEIASAGIAPIFAASSVVSTLGLAGASDTGECVASSLLDRSISATTSG
jgi:hypothetical protein